MQIFQTYCVQVQTQQSNFLVDFSQFSSLFYACFLCKSQIYLFGTSVIHSNAPAGFSYGGQQEQVGFVKKGKGYPTDVEQVPSPCRVFPCVLKYKYFFQIFVLSDRCLGPLPFSTNNYMRNQLTIFWRDLCCPFSFSKEKHSHVTTLI